MHLYEFHRNAPGVALNIRVIDPGDSCGPFDRRTNDGPEPLVEFYDARHPHTHIGQLISSYHQSALMHVDGSLALDLAEPQWTVTTRVMRQLQRILAERWQRPAPPVPLAAPTAADARPGEQAVTVGWSRDVGDMVYTITREFYRNRHGRLGCRSTYEVRDFLGHSLASTGEFTDAADQRLSADAAARAAMPAANPEWNARMLPDWPA